MCTGRAPRRRGEEPGNPSFSPRLSHARVKPAHDRVERVELRRTTNDHRRPPYRHHHRRHHLHQRHAGVPRLSDRRRQIPDRRADARALRPGEAHQGPGDALRARRLRGACAELLLQASGPEDAQRRRRALRHDRSGIERADARRAGDAEDPQGGRSVEGHRHGLLPDRAASAGVRRRDTDHRRRGVVRRGLEARMGGQQAAAEGARRRSSPR